MARYGETAEPLGALLREFGPSRKAVHPSFPFWACVKHNVHGGFPEAIYDALPKSPGLAVGIEADFVETRRRRRDSGFEWTRRSPAKRWSMPL